jgi:steroid 5-alpha reductase family enzyme
MQNFTLREDVKIVILAVLAFIAFGLAFYIAPKRGEVIVIDCTWSEISPDFTTQMR